MDSKSDMLKNWKIFLRKFGLWGYWYKKQNQQFSGESLGASSKESLENSFEGIEQVLNEKKYSSIEVLVEKWHFVRMIVRSGFWRKKRKRRLL